LTKSEYNEHFVDYFVILRDLLHISYYMTQFQFKKHHKDHLTALKHFALQLTKNASDADDLVQETGLKAFMSKHTFKEGLSYKSWAFTILKNSFITKYHKRKRRNIASKPLEELVFAVDQRAVVRNNGISKLHTEEIKSKIDQLSEKSKMPLLMHVRGYHYHEIANMLDIPIGTVKSRINFARKKLRKKLDII